MDEKVSVIVPAYNEAERIGGVLDAIAGHPLVGEVIVVDDGSKDGTAELLRRRTDIRPLILEHNVGKSGAIMRGIQAAVNDIILMIDADLSGLRHEDLSNLIEPVRAGLVDMTVSLRRSALWPYRLFGLDFVSGERAYRKSWIPDLSAVGRLKGYELEAFLNDLIVRGRGHIRVVYLPTVTSPLKHAKAGFIKGWLADIRMTALIARYLTPWGTLRQYFTLLRRRR